MTTTKIEAAARLQTAAASPYVRLATQLGSLIQGVDAKATMINKNDGDPGVVYTASAGNDVLSFGAEEITQMAAQLRRYPDARVYARIMSSTRLLVTVRNANGEAVADPLDLLHDASGIGSFAMQKESAGGTTVTFKGDGHAVKQHIDKWVKANGGKLDVDFTSDSKYAWELSDGKYILLDTATNSLALR